MVWGFESPPAHHKFNYSERKTMAVAIMGGLMLATVLTLLTLPAMYAAWFRVQRPQPAAGE